MISKEHLLAERAKLQQQHGQAVAQANAISGAIELLTALIAKCDEKESELDKQPNPSE